MEAEDPSLALVRKAGCMQTKQGGQHLGQWQKPGDIYGRSQAKPRGRTQSLSWPCLYWVQRNQKCYLCTWEVSHGLLADNSSAPWQAIPSWGSMEPHEEGTNSSWWGRGTRVEEVFTEVSGMLPSPPGEGRGGRCREVSAEGAADANTWRWGIAWCALEIKLS